MAKKKTFPESWEERAPLLLAESFRGILPLHKALILLPELKFTELPLFTLFLATEGISLHWDQPAEVMRLITEYVQTAKRPVPYFTFLELTPFFTQPHMHPYLNQLIPLLNEAKIKIISQAERHDKNMGEWEAEKFNEELEILHSELRDLEKKFTNPTEFHPHAKPHKMPQAPPDIGPVPPSAPTKNLIPETQPPTTEGNFSIFERAKAEKMELILRQLEKMAPGSRRLDLESVNQARWLTHGMAVPLPEIIEELREKGVTVTIPGDDELLTLAEELEIEQKKLQRKKENPFNAFQLPLPHPSREKVPMPEPARPIPPPRRIPRISIPDWILPLILVILTLAILFLFYGMIARF